MLHPMEWANEVKKKAMHYLITQQTRRQTSRKLSCGKRMWSKWVSAEFSKKLLSFVLAVKVWNIYPRNCYPELSSILSQQRMIIIARSLFKCRSCAFFIEQKQCPFSLQDKTKADSMATEIKNKWFLYEAKIFKINWAIKTPRFNGGY